jgi:hypothetical protein
MFGDGCVVHYDVDSPKFFESDVYQARREFRIHDVASHNGASTPSVGNELGDFSKIGGASGIDHDGGTFGSQLK